MRTASSHNVIVSTDYLLKGLKKLCTIVKNVIITKSWMLALLQELHLSGVVQTAHITPTQIRHSAFHALTDDEAFDLIKYLAGVEPKSVPGICFYCNNCNIFTFKF